MTIGIIKFESALELQKDLEEHPEQNIFVDWVTNSIYISRREE